MRALAARCGISQPFLSAVERGLSMPSIATLYRIANAGQPPAGVPALIGVSPMLVPLGALTSLVGYSVPPGAGVSPTPASEQATMVRPSPTAAMAATIGAARRRRPLADPSNEDRDGMEGRLVLRIRRSYPACGDPTTCRPGVTPFTAWLRPPAGTIAGP